jgi:hypothetical protein
VILPEGILLTGAHGSFCGGESLRVDGGERQVAVDQADLAGIGSQQRLVHLLMPATAEWALEVTELDDGDRCAFGTECVSALAGDIIADVLRFLGRDRGS